MKRETRGHLHIGTPSIILVFLTLCLVSFSVLSLVNANADFRLSKKLADRTSGYYEAVNRAESFLAETDAALRDVYLSHSGEAGEEAYMEEAHRLYGEQIEEVFPIGGSAIHSLQVVVEPVLPSGEGDDPACIRVLSYRVISDESGLEYDESLHVIW